MVAMSSFSRRIISLVSTWVRRVGEGVGEGVSEWTGGLEYERVGR